MSDIFSLLEEIGFTPKTLKNNSVPWKIFFCWSSCEHDHWLSSRNRLKENDVRLNVSFQPNGWLVELEAKHNLYHLQWRPSGISVTTNLLKYSRMTPWPSLTSFLQLPELIFQLEDMQEFKQRKQVFSKQVNLDSYYLDLDKDFNPDLFKRWLGPALNTLLLPSAERDEAVEEFDDLIDVKDYPAATTIPGHPFADPNLKLAVMESLMSDNLLSLGDWEDFYRFIHKQYPGTLTDNIAFSQAAYEYLSCYPLSKEQLEKVTNIYLDGASNIYFYLDKFYDGETNEFFVKSLSGIHYCPEVTEFFSQLAVENLDLSPLRQLTNLEKISLDGSFYTNPETLLDVDSLKELKFYGTALNEGIIRALEVKGVKVKSHS
jgi:hypothetical protein